MHSYPVAFTYDSRDNIEQITYPDGRIVEYTYDTENRVQSIPGYVNDPILYHPSGKPETYTLANSRTTTVQFNSRYWISRIMVDGAVMDEEYEYDPAGNLMNLADHISSSNSQSFSFDDLDRLTVFNGPWGNGYYVYDGAYAISRRVREVIGSDSTYYTYDGSSHRLMYTSGAKPYQFCYDNNGNLVSIADKMAITYNHESKPVSINNFESRLTRFAYDGKGERVKKELGPHYPIAPMARQTSDSLAYDEYYCLTGLHGEVLCEIRNPGQYMTDYVYLNGRLLCKVTGNSKHFYHNDYLGTAKAMTDDSGIKVYSWLSYPFGEQFQIAGSQHNNYRFTGKEYDASTGFYYFGARYYFPEIGRFITTDPSGKFERKNPLTLNSYVYCLDNPARYIDPDGLHHMVIHVPENKLINMYNEKIEELVYTHLGFLPGWASTTVKNMLQTSVEEQIQSGVIMLGLGMQLKCPTSTKYGSFAMKMVEAQTDKKGNVVFRLVKKNLVAETKDLKPWVKSLEESAGMYETLKGSAEATDLESAAMVALQQQKVKNFIHKTLELIKGLIMETPK